MNKCGFNSYKNPCIYLIKGCCTSPVICKYKMTDDIEKDAEIDHLTAENAELRAALRLAVEKLRFCPYPPEIIYNPDSECEEQTFNCDKGDNEEECKECIIQYFLRQAEKELQEEQR